MTSSDSLLSRYVVLDTSFFVGRGFNFRSEELSSLAELGNRGALRILIVDITLRELETKLLEMVQTAHAKLGHADLRILKCLPLFRRFGDVYGEQRISLYVNKSLNEFIRRARVEIVDSSDVTSRHVFDRFFRKLPPFNSDSKKQRKNEFPDAFALEAANAWLKSNKQRAYVVSSDSDWHEYCRDSAEWFEDVPRMIEVPSASIVIELVLRNDAALADQTCPFGKPAYFDITGCVKIRREGCLPSSAQQAAGPKFSL